MRTIDSSPLAALRGCPAIQLVPDAGRRFWGLSRAHAYTLAQAGEFPVEVHKVGARLYVRTADVARALGIDPALLLESPAEPVAVAADVDTITED